MGYAQSRDQERHGDPTGVIFQASYPEIVPSLNVLLRLHWAKRKKLQTQWAWTVLASRPATFHSARLSRVHITRHAVKLLDVDNLYGSCKVIVDALKTCQLIWDDSPTYLDLICSQEKCGRKSTKTNLVIEAIDASTAKATAGSPGTLKLTTPLLDLAAVQKLRQKAGY